MAQNKFLFVSIAFVVGLLGGFCGHFLAAPGLAEADGQKALQAGELRITDDSGRTRLLLTLARNKPRLFMLDDAGEYRLEMGLGEGGEPHIWLRDADGAAKVQVALNKAGLPAFRLADQNGRDRAVLGLSAKGEPTLLFRDQNAKDRLALWHDARESGLALADKFAKPIAAFSAPDGGRGRLSLFEASGKAYKVVQ